MVKTGGDRQTMKSMREKQEVRDANSNSHWVLSPILASST
jgi:hypothetical protein